MTCFFFSLQKIAEKAVEKAKIHLVEKKPEEGKKPLDGIDAWVEEMYEIMDPNMAIETKRRIMMNRVRTAVSFWFATHCVLFLPIQKVTN